MQVESIFEKGTGAMNEDFYFASGSRFGVFDGATSLTPETYEQGCTGGYLASNIAGRVFATGDGPLLGLADKANAAISEAMLERGVDLNDKKYLWSTSAAVVSLDNDRFEWVQIGDCLVMVIKEDGSHELLMDGFDHDTETLRMWQSVSAEADDSILNALHDQILKVRGQMNVSYGVFSGEQEAMSFINHGQRDLDGVDSILIFTDGLFVPSCDPERKEGFDHLASLFRQGGLRHVRDYIRSVEETDPCCRRFPRFKPHDDIAAISITF
ncbi:protein phosphatase 2C domain-containing protein [Maridesulfovibrio sp.]|uniref:protein phosphatase 2C domain-containing protein n=1 Tax=Maridesulfovibrio sp. TaxID=2795000 RepID=UPI002A18B8E1|nr:protein phosphatase 2C domain-containing protein [Maridesulfovibrio sp.]